MNDRATLRNIGINILALICVMFSLILISNCIA
jgi:hypothetical protein